MAFCDELKAYITGFIRSGNTYTSNGAAERIKEIIANLFLLFKMDKVSASEYRQWILTFRLKYVFVAGKIIRTARQTILKLLEGYPYKEVFQ
jgi:hypothetical protein